MTRRESLKRHALLLLYNQTGRSHFAADGRAVGFNDAITITNPPCTTLLNARPPPCANKSVRLGIEKCIHRRPLVEEKGVKEKCQLGLGNGMPSGQLSYQEQLKVDGFPFIYL